MYKIYIEEKTENLLREFGAVTVQSTAVLKGRTPQTTGSSVYGLGICTSRLYVRNRIHDLFLERRNLKK